MRTVVEERVPGAGFVYIGAEQEERVVWRKSKDGDYIEVNNHSNWGTVSKPRHRAAAEALRKQFHIKVREVKELSNAR